ncbi:MAG: hypothetical protein ABFR89_12675 [Actinomycetota bacterium]
MTTLKSGNTGAAPRRHGCLLDWAARVDRVLTWGLDPDVRDELLQERAADRYDHLADPDASLSGVFARSLQSAFADLVYRFLGGDVSAVPIAVLFALIGFAAIADTLTSHLPVMLDIFNVTTGIGFLALAVAGFVHPRKLKRAWLLPGAVAVSIGAIAGAILLPVAPEAAMFDWIAKIGLGGGGLGFGLIAGSVASSTPNRVWYQRGGTVVWASGLFLGIGLFGWAIVSTPVYSTRASTLLVAVALVVGAALLSRLRHVPIEA